MPPSSVVCVCVLNIHVHTCSLPVQRSTPVLFISMGSSGKTSYLAGICRGLQAFPLRRIFQIWFQLLSMFLKNPNVLVTWPVCSVGNLRDDSCFHEKCVVLSENLIVTQNVLGGVNYWSCMLSCAHRNPVLSEQTQCCRLHLGIVEQKHNGVLLELPILAPAYKSGKPAFQREYKGKWWAQASTRKAVEEISRAWTLEYGRAWRHYFLSRRPEESQP